MRGCTNKSEAILGRYLSKATTQTSFRHARKLSRELEVGLHAVQDNTYDNPSEALRVLMQKQMELGRTIARLKLNFDEERLDAAEGLAARDAAKAERQRQRFADTLLTVG